MNVVTCMRASWTVQKNQDETSNLHPPRGGTVKLSELMAFHAAVDELFRSYRCRSVYLDVGSNIGVQIRKLYEPEKYPAAPALRIFDDVFGRDRCDVCTIGIEPNPHHTARLTDLERRYRATGLPVLVLIAAASDAESRTQLALEDRDHVNTAEDTGATTVASWQGARAYSSISVVDVRTLDLAALIYRVHRHLQELHGRERGTSRILMKLDVEGSEYSILPHLVLTQTLCLVDRAFLEWHPSNYAPSAVATAAARRHLIEREAGVAAVGTMMRAVNGAIHEILLGARNKFDCRLQSTFLDDEEYLWDGQPWPNTTICSTRAAADALGGNAHSENATFGGNVLGGEALGGDTLGAKTRGRRAPRRRRGHDGHGGRDGGRRDELSSAVRMAFLHPRPGYCDVTIDWEGDCELGLSGSWRAEHYNISSLTTCAAHCREHCPRGNFVSFHPGGGGGAGAECGWFHSCNPPLKMKHGGEKWRTVSTVQTLLEPYM